MLFFDDKLLLKYSGVTGSFLALDRANAAYAAYEAAKSDIDTAVARDAYHAAREHAKPFKPFESKSDAALSVLSIISAPILLTLLALDEMLSFIVFSLKSIAILCTSGADEAKKSGAVAVSHLLDAVKTLLAAAVSPVVNTVDFVSSCVTTFTTETDENPLGYNA